MASSLERADIMHWIPAGAGMTESCRHCERSEANQKPLTPAGLLRRCAPRNDATPRLASWTAAHPYCLTHRGGTAMTSPFRILLIAVGCVLAIGLGATRAQA